MILSSALSTIEPEQHRKADGSGLNSNPPLARSVLTSTDGTTQRSNEDLQVTVVLRRADGTILPQGDYLIRVGMNAAGQLESFDDPPGTTDGNVLSGPFDVVINSITVA